jgi:hypothetical protein
MQSKGSLLQRSLWKHSTTMPSKKRDASGDDGGDGKWTRVVVLESLFSSRVPTGSMFMGPTGILEVKTECMPKGLRSCHSFDMGEIDGQDAKDELIKQLSDLLAAGDARIVPNVAVMHVSTKVARLLFPCESSDEE